MGKAWTKETNLLSSCQQHAVERASSDILPGKKSERKRKKGPSSFPSMSERRNNWSRRQKRSRSFCCQRQISDPRMNFKAAKVISPVLERREKVTNRKICSGDLKNKSYLRNEGIRDLKETLEEVQGDIDSKHPKDKQYIN